MAKEKHAEIVSNGVTYIRTPIKTHFVELGEDLIEVIRTYVSPVWQEGDFITISEKIVSMCQENVVYKKDMKISLEAKFLSRFATQHSEHGIGVGDVYKMQFAIDQCGKLKVLWAAICAGFGKLVGRKGIFYEMVGEQVTGLDGFYPDVFPIYGEFGIKLPEHPVETCDEIYEKLHIPAAIVDANDFEQVICGIGHNYPLTEAEIADVIRDNPSGQSDELTPIVLIRKKA